MLETIAKLGVSGGVGFLLVRAKGLWVDLEMEMKKTETLNCESIELCLKTMVIETPLRLIRSL